jgi:hypothetical protein
MGVADGPPPLAELWFNRPPRGRGDARNGVGSTTQCKPRKDRDSSSHCGTNQQCGFATLQGGRVRAKTPGAQLGADKPETLVKRGSTKKTKKIENRFDDSG